MAKKIVLRTYDQDEFVPGCIPANYIHDPKTGLPCRKKRLTFWVPKSQRSRLLFVALLFNHPEKKINKIARRFFCEKEFAVAPFLYANKVHIISIRRDPHRMISSLNKLEEVISSHIRHESFSAVMSHKSTVEDYWSTLRLILYESNWKVRRRFFKTLVLAHDQVMQSEGVIESA